MNKKILSIFVAMLAVAMLTVPMSAAFAEKPEGIRLFWVGLNAPPTLIPGEVWDSGNIRHARGHDMHGTYVIVGVGINMPSNPSSWIFDFDINTETLMGNSHVTMEIIFNDGTFEGRSLRHGEFYFFGDQSQYANLYTGTSHAVLRGTGAYQGWKIVFSTEVIEGVTVSSEITLFR